MGYSSVWRLVGLASSGSIRAMIHLLSSAISSVLTVFDIGKTHKFDGSVDEPTYEYISALVWYDFDAGICGICFDAETVILLRFGAQSNRGHHEPKSWLET